MKLSAYTTLCEREFSGKTIFLIYSGREGKSVQLSSDVYHSLINSKFDEISPVILSKLKELKIIVPENENELQEINKENLLFTNEINNKLLYFVFQTSANCQLGCDYCGQVHENVSMNDETIDKLIERVKSKYNSTYDKITIGWFGGEPLMAFNKMRLINHEVKAFALEKNIQYESKITTNGLALTLDVFKELIRDFNLRQIEITLDGTADFHDQRRCTKGGKPTYNKIFKNVVEIANYCQENNNKCILSIRCNVDQRNFEAVFPLLKSMVAYDLQNKVMFYVAHIRSWAQNKANKDLSMEEFADKQIDYYLEMHKLGFQFSNVLPERVKMITCLATSIDSEMFDAYGNMFDCTETSYTPVYKNTPFNLGHINQIKNSELQSRAFLRFNSDMRGGIYPKCTSCKYYPQCGGSCPKALFEDEPMCPFFIHNIVDLIFLDFLFRRTSYEQLQ